MKTLLPVAATAVVLVGPTSAAVSTADAVPSLYKSCTYFNKKIVTA